MADSTVLDISKLKVIELRKELKTRGLPHTGAKDELVARLQAAMSQDDHGDINLDSDEIDSDGVLDDEDDKSQTDILDDAAADTLNEELALAEPPKDAIAEAKPAQKPAFKRKLTTDSAAKSEEKVDKEPTAKKIVLNRAASITTPSKPDEEPEKEKSDSNPATTESGKVKITADIDSKSRLELRANRFGLPVKMSDSEKKEARMKRFGKGAGDSDKTDTAKSTTDGKKVDTISDGMKSKLELRAKRFGLPVNASDNDKKEARKQRFGLDTGTTTIGSSEQLEKLKKRAERFGQSVSKVMIDIENKEKLESRKAKFGAA